jgi:DNA (cytosine-5)-methyltransferase 1
MIPNHASSKLSELDVLIARSVPPGGNWRDIPEALPSKRIAQIRVSAAAGEGSRSTYYGRLRADKPAYTINTYYPRPGNGCFLHYDAAAGQHRTLSHREAARLQSFPDDFIFLGSSQRSLCQQIGNAVPPLLAFQIANQLGSPGLMLDVFAGAGGLSLGFEWAGWKSIAAVDSDRHAVSTFNANIAPVAFVGDMNDDAVHDRLLMAASMARGTARFALVGGPPCQGFSTGGHRRSTEDVRNHLYERYAALVERLKPDVFVFENVLGLLSMEKGAFVTAVLQSLRNAGYDVVLWRLNAAAFGVPQRRERVVIVGVPKGRPLPDAPTQWTQYGKADLFTMIPACSAADAIGDLPAISHSQDGSSLAYRSPPLTDYQRLMRADMLPQEYVMGGRRDYDLDRQSGAISIIVGGPPDGRFR